MKPDFPDEVEAMLKSVEAEDLESQARKMKMNDPESAWIGVDLNLHCFQT